MFLRDSELKNTAERVCNGYSKLINVDEGQGGSKLFFLCSHIATWRRCAIQEMKHTTMVKPQPTEHPSPRLIQAVLAILLPPSERSADARPQPKQLSYEARPVPNIPRRLPKIQEILERMHRMHQPRRDWMN